MELADLQRIEFLKSVHLRQSASRAGYPQPIFTSENKRPSVHSLDASAAENESYDVMCIVSD